MLNFEFNYWRYRLHQIHDEPYNYSISELLPLFSVAYEDIVRNKLIMIL